MGEDANPLSQRARIEQAINDGLDEAAVLPTFQLRVLTVQLVANRIESLPAAPRVREPAGNHSGNSEDRNRMSRSTSQPSLRSAIENAVVHGLAEAALWSATPEQRALVVQLVTDRVERLPSTFPDPAGGCVCGSYSEDRGGGYFELMQEYEPACPEHSEHLYNPRTGEWVQDASGATCAASQAYQRYICDVEQVMRGVEDALGGEDRHVELYGAAVKRLQADLKAVDMSR